MAEDLVQETKTTQPTPMEAAQSDAAAKATQYTTTEYKVLPLVFMGEAENDFVIGFYKEPSRQAKLSLLDRIYVGAAMSAAADIFDACFMPEVSDTRIQSDDKYYFGACKAINNHILVAVDQYKKK